MSANATCTKVELENCTFVAYKYTKRLSLIDIFIQFLFSKSHVVMLKTRKIGGALKGFR